MNKKIILRIVIGFAMMGFLIWGYWWLTWALAVVLLFSFPLYFEIIFFGIVYDALYGDYVFTLLSIILFLISFFIKKSLSAYESQN